MRYRLEIDGLRAVAVFAVLLNHFFEDWVPNGFLGVDVFFVISGFVITASLQARRFERLGEFLIGFYVRRIKRLFPVLATCIIVSSLLICLVDPTPLEYLRTGLAATFGLSNIYLYSLSANYFADAVQLNPFTHTWSLGVEEQFYLLFPVLFWWGAQAAPRKVVWLGGAALIASIIAWWIASAADPMLAFYIVVFRVWQLGLGVCAYYLQRRLTSEVGARGVMKWLGVFAILAGVLSPEPVSVIGLTLLVTVSTALVLCLTQDAREMNPFLGLGPVRYVGRISYSLYVWHWPVAVFFAWTVGLDGMMAVFGLALSLALGALSYHGIEQPTRLATWASRPGRELFLGLGSLVGVSLLLVLNGFFLQPHLFLGERPEQGRGGAASLVQPYQSLSGAIWQGEDCVLAANADADKRIERTQCVVGAPLEQAERQVLVMGNSYSAAFVPAFDRPGTERDTSFIVTSSWGASPVPGLDNDGPWAEANAAYWARVLPHLGAELRSGDHVLLVSDLASLSPSEAGQGQARTIERIEEGLRSLSAELAPRGIGLTILGPLHFAREANCEPELALPQWYAPGGGPCLFHHRDATLERLAQFNDVLARLEAEGVVRVIDLFDRFCPGDICGYLGEDGTLMYRDIWSHPSVEAARMVGEDITFWLDRLDQP